MKSVLGVALLRALLRWCGAVAFCLPLRHRPHFGRRAVLMLLPLIALADTRYVYTKDGKSLNLRSTPKSNTGNKIGNIPYGTKIIVREYLDDGWAYVKYGKRFGYVMSKYLWEVKPLPKKTRTTRR